MLTDVQSCYVLQSSVCNTQVSHLNYWSEETSMLLRFSTLGSFFARNNTLLFFWLDGTSHLGLASSHEQFSEWIRWKEWLLCDLIQITFFNACWDWILPFWRHLLLRRRTIRSPGGSWCWGTWPWTWRRPGSFGSAYEHRIAFTFTSSVPLLPSKVILVT